MKPQTTTSFRLFVLTLAAFILGCGAVADPAADGRAAGEGDAGTAACTDSPAPGKFVHTLSVAGVSREVIVYVPQNAAANAPAVFMFHGSTGTGEKFYNISRWREKADETGLIAVFPTALVHCFYDTKDQAYKVQTKWSGGKFGTEHLLCTPEELDQLPANLRAAADHPEADDIGFAGATIDLLTSDYCVDSQRVYSVGFSNGATFSGRVGLELSARIAAFAMSSGAPVVDSLPSRPISAMLNVGAVESGFPADETALNDVGYQTELVETAAQLGLTGAYEYEPVIIAGVDVAQFSFRTSSQGNTNSFQALVIDGLAHNYPNGTNHPVRMADVHWDFFEQHALSTRDE